MLNYSLFVRICYKVFNYFFRIFCSNSNINVSHSCQFSPETSQCRYLNNIWTFFKIRYERIRNFALISEDFTQENGMLTPKLSVKRRNVMQKWGGELEKLYK